MRDNILDPLLDTILYNYEEIPEWYRDNKYIKKGYRRWELEWIYYIKSIFKLHNETFNIWSHLIGSFLFITLSIITYKYNLINSYIVDKIMISLFLFSSFICFFISSIMHIFFPKSEHTCNCLLLGDYYGIIFLILCTYNIFLYYLFYCNNTIQYYYYIIINSLALIIFILLKILNNNKYKKYKLSLLLIFILSIFIPTVHRYIYYKHIDPYELIQEIKYYGMSLFVYLLGFIFYITKIPESICNHKCVNYFTSHTIFHILIVFATIINYYGILNLHNLFEKIICKNNTVYLT